MDTPELTEQEMALLRALADEWDRSGPPGYLETAVIARALQLTVPEAQRVLHSLFVKGLAGTDEIDHYAGYLLPEGYEIARK
jgi:DNA-binding IclR family transcriptional regulator